MNQNWNLTLKNRKPDGRYNISVRCYENGKDRYMDTDYRVTREEWESGSVDRIKKQLITKIDSVIKEIESSGEEVEFDLFKKVWRGERLESERTWISLLDEHMKRKSNEYKFGTKRIYADTRTLLVKLQKAGYDLSLSKYTTVEDYQALQAAISKVARLGKTALAIHMQNIKTIAATGYDPRIGLKWIKSDAFRFYTKPPRKKGTHPNTLEDLAAIKNFDVTIIARNKKVAAGLKFGRDFWVWMVECGGMEARSIAFMEWKNVHKDYFTFERAKTERSDGTEIVMSTRSPMTQYILDTYGVKNNPHGYVFPILKKDMSVSEQEMAITNLANRITRNVKKIARHLGISPLPSCKRTRPTFAVLSDALGFDIKEQQRLMGHKRISTTEIYMTHVPLKSKISTSEKFAAELHKKVEDTDQTRTA